MTINRDWVGVMKEECPAAFTEKPPFRPRVAFIDGMPLLMKSGAVTKWDELVRYNFVSAVHRFFRIGAQVVVLGFDVYSLVPMAKAITQANRSKNAHGIDFTDASQLPNVVPVEYNDFMRNRAFKRRVIQMVVETLPGLLALRDGQEFVVDYESCPIRFSHDASLNKVVQTFMVDIPPLGECDVKATRWMRLYGDGVMHSVDGDFLPIALMEYEDRVRRMSGGGGAVVRPFKMAVYRMKFGAGGDDDGNEGGGQGSSGSKRDSRGVAVVHAGGGVSKKKGRQMEYVMIPLLYECIYLAMRQCAGTGSRSRSSHDSRYMEMLACLIGLTGTDFTRKLPLVGVKKVWGVLAESRIWNGLLTSYNPDELSLDVDQACDALVSGLYNEVYKRHIPSSQGTLVDVLQDLANAPKLSDLTKKRLPTAGRVDATIRNINWLLQYWRCKQPERASDGDEWQYSRACPDPVCDLYGFRKSTGRKCAVQWLDEAL